MGNKRLLPVDKGSAHPKPRYYQIAAKISSVHEDSHNSVAETDGKHSYDTLPAPLTVIEEAHLGGCSADHKNHR